MMHYAVQPAYLSSQHHSFDLCHCGQTLLNEWALLYKQCQLWLWGNIQHSSIWQLNTQCSRFITIKQIQMDFLQNQNQNQNLNQENLNDPLREIDPIWILFILFTISVGVLVFTIRILNGKKVKKKKKLLLWSTC